MGAGDIIFRGVEDNISTTAQMFDAQPADLMPSVADAESQAQPLVPERIAKRAQKCGAEAVDLRRVGWTRWSRPRAPKADGTRKVAWQTTHEAGSSSCTYWCIGGSWHERSRQRDLQSSCKTGLQTRETRALARPR